jgi:hypothetical protein
VLRNTAARRLLRNSAEQQDSMQQLGQEWTADLLCYHVLSIFCFISRIHQIVVVNRMAAKQNAKDFKCDTCDQTLEDLKS